MLVPWIPCTTGNKCYTILRCRVLGVHTTRANKRSSRIIASCRSVGTRSKLSIRAFPFVLETAGLMETRELRGARTKDASSIKDGSSLPEVLDKPSGNQTNESYA